MTASAWGVEHSQPHSQKARTLQRQSMALHGDGTTLTSRDPSFPTLSAHPLLDVEWLQKVDDSTEVVPWLALHLPRAAGAWNADVAVGPKANRVENPSQAASGTGRCGVQQPRVPCAALPTWHAQKHKSTHTSTQSLVHCTHPAAVTLPGRLWPQLGNVREVSRTVACSRRHVFRNGVVRPGESHIPHARSGDRMSIAVVNAAHRKKKNTAVATHPRCCFAKPMKRL
jgi:hypothetical protein